MKKIALVLALSVFAGAAMAQEAADKKVQAGLVFGAGMNFQKMGTKLMAANGIGSDLTIGANMNYGLNEAIALNIGIEFDFENQNYKSGTNPVYYYYNDNKILDLVDVNPNQNPNSKLFQLSERKSKSVMLTIPTMLMFRTNYIGYFRYFGKFGLRNSFLLSNKVNDEGFVIPDEFALYSSTPTFDFSGALPARNDNMRDGGYPFGNVLFKSAVGLAGGAEWNFTGGTVLVAELGYYYGFTPLFTSPRTGDPANPTVWDNTDNKLDADNSYISVAPDNGSYKMTLFNNKATQSQVLFKLSILF